ncbi:hypothetical protein [Vibrio phage vB_VpM-pA2SJ1]|uniref:Uncharacterized protein n=1 Tax=Vibrio phage vB_VpM-pA2SJ1 TaxID=3095964 RepID=A0AAX4J5N1_9CAUD
MAAHIKHITPDLVELSELRPGDNFEHPNRRMWVFKKVSGVKQFCTDHNVSENVCYAVTECSGEVMQFAEDEKVIPLKEPVVEYEYDFEREFESKRED